MNYSIDFDDLSHSLARMQANAEAAESQGILCGMIAAIGRADKDTWVHQVVGGTIDPSNVLDREVVGMLEHLYTETQAQLHDENMGFSLFLPEDDVGFEDRLLALSEWCQGFLLGFSMHGNVEQEDLPGEVQELLQDFIEITNMDIDSSDDPDEDENAYMEIEEYIRVGALYVIESQHTVPTSSRLQ